MLFAVFLICMQADGVVGQLVRAVGMVVVTLLSSARAVP